MNLSKLEIKKHKTENKSIHRRGFLTAEKIVTISVIFPQNKTNSGIFQRKFAIYIQNIDFSQTFKYRYGSSSSQIQMEIILV